MRLFLLSLLALLGVSTMAMAQSTIEVTLLEDQSGSKEKVSSLALNSNETFWALFEAQDESLALTVVVDNSNCSNEIGYANVGFGGNYNGTVSSTSTPTTVWLSAEGAGTVSGTTTETYTFSVADIIALFSAEATQSWDLGATVWVDSEDRSAWGGSYGTAPNVTTVEPYLDDEFTLENLTSLQVQVNNSSVLVSVSYSYSYVVEEAEVTSSVSLDLPAMKQAIIVAYVNEEYTYDETTDVLTKGSGDDAVTVDFTTDAVHAVADYLEASGNDFFTVAEGSNHASYREQSNLAHICLRGGLVFELENASALTVEVSSTGNDPKYSDFYLLDATGTAIEVSEISGIIDENASEDKLAIYKGQPTYVVGDGESVFNAETILLTVGQYATRTSSYHTTATWVLAEGTYTLYGRNSGSFSSDLRIYDITIEDASIDESGNETEIEGYLTVAMGSTNLLENEATKIVVTEDVDGKTTVAVPAELPIDLGITTMTVTDLSVTFTADEYGAFTDGVASFKLNSVENTVNSIEGTFVTTDEGVTTFESTIAVYEYISIAVSFTTEAPVVEEWTLITSQLDQTPYIENDGNSWLALSASALSVYEYVALDVTVDLEAGYSNFGALLTAGDYDSKYTNSDYDQTDGNFDNLEGTEHVYLVFSVATLTDACTTTDGAIPFVFWGNTLAVSVYGSADYDGEVGTFYPEAEAGTEEGTTGDETSVEWKLASQSWGANWEGTTWTGVSSATGVLELTTTVGDIMTADGVEELGGINFQIWNVNGYEGTEISWTFTVTKAEGETVVTDAGQGVIGTNYEVSEYGAITLGQYCTSICYGSYTFATTDVVNATVTIVGDIVYNAISDIKADIEVVEVARYNLMGQKISGAEKGINIIVYSDGSAKKVLVK